MQGFPDKNVLSSNRTQQKVRNIINLAVININHHFVTDLGPISNFAFLPSGALYIIIIIIVNICAVV